MSCGSMIVTLIFSISANGLSIF